MTTHVGHYFIKALEEWKTAAKINTRPGHETEVGDSIRILELLGEEAAHWVLSTSALQFIWNTDIAKTDLTDMRMPFPTMIVEYLFDYGALGYDTNKIAPERDLAAERFFIFHENNDTEEDSIFMLAGFRLQADKDYNIPVRWVFSPVALTMTYQSLYQLNDWVKQVEGGFDVILDPAICKVVPSLPVYREAKNDMSAEDLRAATADLFDEFKIMINLLAVLSCDNAPVVEIPAPTKLNQKRGRAGKIRLPSYRTLHISNHESQPHRGTGTHASPRTHWRRGHIRNQPTAKGTIRRWIKPQIINAGAAVPAKPEVVLT